MKKVTGIEITEDLVALEARNDLGFDVEVEPSIKEETMAKGVISFMNVGFSYEYNGKYLLLELTDREAYFDHVQEMDMEEIQKEEERVQVKMEDLLEIGTVVKLQ